MRREAGPPGVPWPGGMQDSKGYTGLKPKVHNPNNNTKQVVSKWWLKKYTGLKPKVYNSNKTQKQVLSKFVKRISKIWWLKAKNLQNKFQNEIWWLKDKSLLAKSLAFNLDEAYVVYWLSA